MAGPAYDAAMSGSRPEWTVLLIGGASGVGKSMLGHRLASRLGVNITEVDDIQIALETITGHEHLLHLWHTCLDEYLSWSDEQRVEHHVRVCREVFQPVMQVLIAEHLRTGTRVVYEGDFLLPELATMTTYGGESNQGRVGALFVSERDAAQIAANHEARDGGVEPARSRTSSLFDALIRAECMRHKMPIVDARPWATVVDRALAALSLSGHPPIPRGIIRGRGHVVLASGRTRQSVDDRFTTMSVPDDRLTIGSRGAHRTCPRPLSSPPYRHDKGTPAWLDPGPAPCYGA